ncbi:hypothetical protein THAOC_32477 [Thalassiosira oceanica]|uniref:Uncharacterized protein n=1 Tax=Thalassiosira oceanica TaxID=159749 RepID=K0RPV9_THAOC|nr:hypothetical protein THAOC_32477 [Thalassiosira oceanica]|eukprot:EJK48702.1 hypothetical protein THAOC_32477 [Thalassiosira oceanica]
MSAVFSTLASLAVEFITRGEFRFVRLQLWGRAGDWRLPRGEFIGLALLDLLLELPLAVALVCSLAHVSIGRRPWSGRTVVGICSVVTVDKGTFHPFAAAVACAGWEGGRRGTTEDCNTTAQKMPGLLALGEAADMSDEDLFVLLHLSRSDEQRFIGVIDRMDNPAIESINFEIMRRVDSLGAELDNSRIFPELSKMDNGKPRKVREAEDMEKEIHLLLELRTELVRLVDSRVFGENTAAGIPAPDDKDDGCCGLGGCFGLLPFLPPGTKKKDALVPMEQEGLFTDATVRPDPQSAVSSIMRPNLQFGECTDCPECDQSPLYHDMHGGGLQVRDPVRLGNQVARDENKDEGDDERDDEGNDAQIDVVPWPLDRRQLDISGFRMDGTHLGILFFHSTFLVIRCRTFWLQQRALRRRVHGCQSVRFLRQGQLGFQWRIDHDVHLRPVQFRCVFWPTAESHAVSHVLAALSYENHCSLQYVTFPGGELLLGRGWEGLHRGLQRRGGHHATSDEEDRKRPGKDLAGSSDSESKRSYLRIDDSSDEEEPANPAKKPRAIHLNDSSDSDSEDHTHASSSRSSSHGTQSAARGSRSSNSAARRGIPTVSDQQNSSVKDKIPQPELKAIQDEVGVIISDDNRLQADQVDMDTLTILEGKNPTRGKIRRGFKVARNILHNWVHNCSTSESNPWGRALLCNHMIMVLERLKDSMLVSEKVKYPLLAFLWIAKCMLPKGKRQGATLEAGGHIDDGPRSLCDVATTKGVDALVSTMPQGGLDYCTSEDGNPFPGIVFNRAPYCEMKDCKKHCKEWTIVLAARMMIPTLAYIYFVCGVLGIPLAIGNVGGTGCKYFFQVLLYTLSLLPDEILAFITVAPMNTHAHNLCWLPIGHDLGGHLSMVRRYLTNFFGVMGGFFGRLRFRKQMLDSDEELPSKDDMLTCIYDNDDANYCQPATREGNEAGENARFAQVSAIGRQNWNARVDEDGMERVLEFMAKIGRQGGLASWKSRVERDGMEKTLERMGDLGRASVKSRIAALGDQGFCDSMAKASHAANGIDSNVLNELKSALTEAVRMATQSPGFQDKGHHDKLTIVQGQLVAKIDEQWTHLTPASVSHEAKIIAKNCFLAFLGSQTIKIFLDPCTKDTKMLTRALHSVIYAEKKLCKLLLYKEGIGQEDTFQDLSGLKEFVHKVLTADKTPMVYKLHKCPNCAFVLWMKNSKTQTRCPPSKTDLNGNKGCGNRSKKWTLMMAKAQRSITSFFS